MGSLEDDAEIISQLIAQVYAIHEVVIAESGGMEGLRDGAMLHAAVARPFATFAGERICAWQQASPFGPRASPKSQTGFVGCSARSPNLGLAGAESLLEFVWQMDH